MHNFGKITKKDLRYKSRCAARKNVYWNLRKQKEVISIFRVVYFVYIKSEVKIFIIITFHYTSRMLTIIKIFSQIIFTKKLRCIGLIMVRANKVELIMMSGK